MSKRIKILIGITLLINAIVLIACLTNTYYHNLSELKVATKNVNVNGEITQAIPVMDIKLSFISQEDWDKDPNAKYPNTAAYTKIGHRPCEIVMPAGHLISAKPDLGDAKWLDSFDNNVIPHEILHCILGYWHPDWDTVKLYQQIDKQEIMFKTIKADKEYKIDYVKDPVLILYIHDLTPILYVKKDRNIVCAKITKKQYNKILKEDNINSTYSILFPILWKAGNCKFRRN